MKSGWTKTFSSYSWISALIISYLTQFLLNIFFSLCFISTSAAHERVIHLNFFLSLLLPSFAFNESMHCESFVIWTYTQKNLSEQKIHRQIKEHKIFNIFFILANCTITWYCHVIVERNNLHIFSHIQLNWLFLFARKCHLSSLGIIFSFLLTLILFSLFFPFFCLIKFSRERARFCVLFRSRFLVD